ncbi:hypothetical protein Pmar_PMAR005982 [Perkinsus marinus ATCC 50983]|uniref:Uncharacterized protein n=1 Tax=Perkinsus marinus (strain ATCC 50983 / TXsc) TaxID=423536 RepID=C5L9W4_PERM5|nr:hypothetical protein Pmar_PMAR005982 [Perkinsus marinus ATCC 50983]EER06220.1 hypothetical protein Pmar_PMAR005982 [Perkinsus marinus ATCC 50983]|eukprot:XP_002774404.1 hypothetical protein Pmar_PMAR005982 [Perkinsus marinus ATCC 50983]
MVTKSEDAFPDVRLREELMFIVGGCACLTLLVNATTAHALVNILGFTELTTSKKILLKNVDLSIAEAAREMYDELLVDDEVLRTSCPKTLTEAVSTLRLRRAGGDSGEESPKRNVYWDFMDLGLLPRNSTAAQLLIYSVDTAKQFHVEKKMNDWNKLRRRLESKERAALWRLKQKMRLSTDFASSWTELTVYVVDSFAAAHVRAQKSIARVKIRLRVSRRKMQKVQRAIIFF